MLTSLADGAELLFTGLVLEQSAANVAECYDIPLATLHWFPVPGCRLSWIAARPASGPVVRHLYDSGMRICEALGLRRNDIVAAECVR